MEHKKSSTGHDPSGPQRPATYYIYTPRRENIQRDRRNKIAPKPHQKSSQKARAISTARAKRERQINRKSKMQQPINRENKVKETDQPREQNARANQSRVQKARANQKPSEPRSTNRGQTDSPQRIDHQPTPANNRSNTSNDHASITTPPIKKIKKTPPKGRRGAVDVRRNY